MIRIKLVKLFLACIAHDTIQVPQAADLGAVVQVTARCWAATYALAMV